MRELLHASHGTDSSQVRAIVSSAAHDAWRLLSTSPVLIAVLLLVAGCVLVTVFRTLRRARYFPEGVRGKVVRRPRDR